MSTMVQASGSASVRKIKSQNFPLSTYTSYQFINDNNTKMIVISGVNITKCTYAYIVDMETNEISDISPESEITIGEQGTDTKTRYPHTIFLLEDKIVFISRNGQLARTTGNTTNLFYWNEYANYHDVIQIYSFPILSNGKIGTTQTDYDADTKILNGWNAALMDAKSRGKDITNVGENQFRSLFPWVRIGNYAYAFFNSISQQSSYWSSCNTQLFVKVNLLDLEDITTYILRDFQAIEMRDGNLKQYYSTNIFYDNNNIIIPWIYNYNRGSSPSDTLKIYKFPLSDPSNYTLELNVTGTTARDAINEKKLDIYSIFNCYYKDGNQYYNTERTLYNNGTKAINESFFKKVLFDSENIKVDVDDGEYFNSIEKEKLLEVANIPYRSNAIAMNMIGSTSWIIDFATKLFVVYGGRANIIEMSKSDFLKRIS